MSAAKQPVYAEQRHGARRTSDQAMADRVAELEALEKAILGNAPLPPDPRIAQLEAVIANLVEVLWLADLHLGRLSATNGNLRFVIQAAVARATAP
jgi:hypothetical protein